MSEDFDKTRPPLRITIAPEMDATMPGRRVLEPVAEPADIDATMPGKRDRKDDGRFAVGDLIMNRYKVLSELGQGGMGVVYRCLDETAGVEVALKALPPELSHNTLEMEDIKENFQLVSQLVHQNIAVLKQLERNIANGNYYLIMECCEGEDLRRWIKRKRKEGTLTLEVVLPIIQQVAAALDYAHSEKIIHRDIKPGNIMIDQSGKIKVLDFGLAAQIHTSMTRVSMAYHGTSGTGPYMAPEQWRGRAQGASADQYALAVMTYEMLAGHLPFESSDAAVLREAVLNDTPEEITVLPKNASEALKRAMSKEPAERFASCSDFILALAGKKVKGAVKTDKRSWVKWAAVAMIFALLGAGGYWYYTFDRQQKERLAAEWAEKERREKLAEEELDSENTALKVELTSKIAEIERRKYDPAQTFGAKTREMKIAFAVAQEVKLLSTANREYKKAQKLADWILLNGELRKECQSLREQAKKNQTAALRYEPETYAVELYRNAENSCREAEKSYNNAEFAAAKKEFEKAVNGFEQARKTAFDNKLRYLITEAEKAKKSARWDDVKAWAEKIRPLDSDKAAEFIAFAEKQITLERFNSRLAAARQAKAEKNWQKVYEYAEAALNIDSSSIDAKNLMYEAKKQIMLEKLNKELAAARQAKAEKNWQKVYEYAKAAFKIGSGSIEARNLLYEARNLMYEAEKQIKQEKLNKVLSAARQAKAEKNWQKVYEYAEAALGIDSSNSEAQQLKQESEPTLEIIATVDGRRVPAKVTIDGVQSDTMQVFKNFHANTQYEIALRYQNGDEDEVYVNNINLTCNWWGRRTITVELLGSNHTITLSNGVKVEMVLVEPGSFTMSKNYGNEIEHPKTLTKPFYIGKYEVTQAQWKSLMGTDIHQQAAKYGPLPIVTGVGDNHPMYFVSWLEAMEFCEKMNKYAPPGWKFTLPTETQWEFAARGGNKSRDYKYSGSNTPGDVAWYGANSGRTTHEVGGKDPNELGLYDMSGNVDEWCLDNHHYQYESRKPKAEFTRAYRDSDDSWRICRGSHWGYSVARSRHGTPPASRWSHLGFRLALVQAE